jgi:hypothetical protein
MYVGDEPFRNRAGGRRARPPSAIIITIAGNRFHPRANRRVSKHDPKALPIIGWREWVSLPDLGVERIKAKIDTGARSSSLHAFDVKTFEKDGQAFVRFKVHPIQRSSKETVVVEAPVLEFRRVRSSSGHAHLRPVIVTTVEALGRSWPIELTLANRDAMGFRMLLGREAIRGRMLVDAQSSYYGGQPVVARKIVVKKKRTKKTKKKAKRGKRRAESEET